MQKISLSLIRFYQRWVSPLLAPSCRFEPSCSSYTAQAIEQFGAGRGLLLGIKRLAKCHPFNAGGYDPVPSASSSQEHVS